MIVWHGPYPYPTIQEIINALPPLPGRPRKNFELVLMARDLKAKNVPLTIIGAAIIACRDRLSSVREAEEKTLAADAPADGPTLLG